MIVLSLVVLMTMLSVTFFISVSGETTASRHQSEASKAQQLAMSAAQMIMAQIKAASTATKAGTGPAVAWTSQPGLLRTFTPSGPSTVFKLYSATGMVSESFAETDDSPPSDWKQSPALFCDINAPAISSGALVYPVADPALAGTVPGFALGSAPGYSGSSPAPTNNPLPMPVRWLYVLKSGEVATPESVAASGAVTFSGAQPAADNPVVGRLAFWTDDETCKVNVNTAGYAANTGNYSTYWDTPMQCTQYEDTVLSSAQPWTNEFLRYPGHPATTGLNVVFSDLNLTPDQIANLTPCYRNGGSKGGTIPINSPPSADDIKALLKNARLYPTVDEFFYDPDRTATNAAGITHLQMEQRRFLLTTTSRAPETTLLDTPRVTIWPTWQTEGKRSPLDKLIAFCSTLANQPFYFVRENPLSSRELLDISSNLRLYNYLQEITSRNLPGAVGNFLSKYSPAKNRDQILTSIFDAIRLANLIEPSNPGGYSFAAGTSPVGYVAPIDGPSGTRGAGRASTLAEVGVLFARPSNEQTMIPDPRNPAAQVRKCDIVNAMMLYGFVTPAAGMVVPGHDMKMVVSGLSGFLVEGQDGLPQQLFASGTFTNTRIDTTNRKSTSLIRRNYAEGVSGNGGIDWTLSAQTSNSGAVTSFVPPTATLVLPYDPANPTAENLKTFKLTGTIISVSVYSPADSLVAQQVFSVSFPDAPAVLTPMPTLNPWATTPVTGQPNPGRFQGGGEDTYLSIPGDTVVAMQSPTSDHRSEILRSGTISDFVKHARYGLSDFLNTDKDSRRASSFRQLNANNHLPQVKGSLFASLDVYGNHGQVPALTTRPNGTVQALAAAFPSLDFSNGPGDCPDGSWSPKTDEGKSAGGIAGAAYFRSPHTFNDAAEGTLSAPNRQMPSAVLFGSVPTGVYNNPFTPWRTLLFHPARSFHMGGTGHFGATAPPDWYLLDFFHMPIVEPYAISEPFSTAGKVNMNARVMPFSGYLQRETALHAVLRSTRIVAIPETAASTEYWTSPRSSATTRYALNEEETLASIRDRYDGADGNGNRVFLSSAEICSIDLIPQGATRSSLASFWADKRTTGDNSRESPYSTLVPRLTTKSNTYTVHVLAQVLMPGPGIIGWQEGRGRVVAQWRGSIGIERYVDPNDLRFSGAGAPDFLSGTQPVGPYYRFHVLGSRRFDQ
ncbi:MAG: Verru_Chthon cassette protein A [Phycisphaerae bacterium]